MKKIVVTDEPVGRVEYSIFESKFNGEKQKAIGVTLANGDKLTFYENEASFCSVGQYLKQGDIMSFTAEKQTSTPWETAEGEKRTTTRLSGLADMSVTAGVWSEEPIAGLEGRSAVSADKFKERTPHDSAPPTQQQFTAPPNPAITGSGTISADHQVAGDLTADGIGF